MISSGLRALWRVLAKRFEAARRLRSEHLCGGVAAAGEAAAAAYDDEHLPARVAGDASSMAAAGRR